MIVRRTMSAVEDLRDELGFYGDIISTSAGAKTEGGRKIQSIMQNALLNLAFKDLLIPSAQSLHAGKDSIDDAASLQLITSLFLLILTLTNLKPKPPTSDLYHSLISQIFKNCDTLPRIYES